MVEAETKTRAKAQHKEGIANSEIQSVLEAFRSALECVPRGICMPDEAHVVVSRYYVSFVHDSGEVKATRDGVEVKAGDYVLTVDSYGNFVLMRAGKRVAYGPRLVVGNEVYTADEFVNYVRKGLQTLLNSANWL